MELHGGTIGVKSEGLGKGSEFSIRLPLTSLPPATDLEAEDWYVSEPALRRVLVVDDNVDAAASLGMMLEVKGHTVQTVHDASEALKAVENFSPEVVLLDIELPGMSGYEVARRIRAMSNGNHLTLIAITGRGQQDDKQRAKEAGFDEHLTKPVDTGVLETLMSAGGAP
jgi:CheY-like chemotaxis protein